MKEVTLDMAKNMETVIKKCFKKSYLVIDRFHVIRLASEAMQQIRIQMKWKAIENENENIQNCKKQKLKYEPEILKNGDTMKQLLSRSKYILSKKRSEWTENQKERAEILFEKYPEIKKYYEYYMYLRSIYKEQEREKASKRIDEWIKMVHENQMKNFYSVCNTIKNYEENILNFFIKRNTNANAESFNAKIKLFRANLRGVIDKEFFLFRLAKLFA